MDKEAKIARLRERLRRLENRKREADLRSAYWLMTANDIEEQKIGPLRAQIARIDNHGEVSP